MTVIFFDLDGTLTDPRPGIVGSIQHALARLGVPVPPEDELLWCIGPPLRDSFARLLGEDADLDRAIALYRERFQDVGLYENSVYPGMDELLSRLNAAGISLAVATSKPQVYAERILVHFGLDRHFDAVFGAELSGERSDKTELLTYAIEQMGINPSGSTMIGDRSHDMVGAGNVGMTGVGVLYGYGSLEELRAAGAARIVERVEELDAALGIRPARRR